MPTPRKGTHECQQRDARNRLQHSEHAQRRPGSSPRPLEGEPQWDSDDDGGQKRHADEPQMLRSPDNCSGSSGFLRAAPQVRAAIEATSSRSGAVIRVLPSGSPWGRRSGTEAC